MGGAHAGNEAADTQLELGRGAEAQRRGCRHDIPVRRLTGGPQLALGLQAGVVAHAGCETKSRDRRAVVAGFRGKMRDRKEGRQCTGITGQCQCNEAAPGQAAVSRRRACCAPPAAATGKAWPQARQRQPSGAARSLVAPCTIAATCCCSAVSTGRCASSCCSGCARAPGAGPKMPEPRTPLGAALGAPAGAGAEGPCMEPWEAGANTTVQPPMVAGELWGRGGREGGVGSGGGLVVPPPAAQPSLPLCTCPSDPHPPAALGAGGEAAVALGGGGELGAASGGPSKPLTAGAGGLERSPSGMGEGEGEAPRGHSVRDQPLRAISRLQGGGARTGAQENRT